MHAAGRKVEEVMTRELVTVSEDDSVVIWKSAGAFSCHSPTDLGAST